MNAAQLRNEKQHNAQTRPGDTHLPLSNTSVFIKLEHKHNNTL